MYGSLIKFTLVLALLGGLYGSYKYKVHQAVTQAVQTVELRHKDEVLAEKEVLFVKKRAAEKELEKDFNKRQGEYNEKINSLNNTVSGLLASLSDRPPRPVSTSSDSAVTRAETSPTGAYPSQLYREDAKNLIDFSRDAEEIRLGLLQCYNDYDAAKKSIELFTEKK
jgi:hypothetical protein